jgi:hypothetical protein
MKNWKKSNNKNMLTRPGLRAMSETTRGAEASVVDLASARQQLPRMLSHKKSVRSLVYVFRAVTDVNLLATIYTYRWPRCWFDSSWMLLVLFGESNSLFGALRKHVRIKLEET